jgi:UDP-GlcNAc3NAcA epimerase
MHRPRVALCYGTRPQVIKASRLSEALRDRFDVLTVDTGQHYDYELNALLYSQLGVSLPDVVLDVRSGSHAEQTAAVLTRAASVLSESRPDAVVVIGDTNSTLGCALAATQLGMPLVHVEAGLRSGDLRMAEELNRRAVDAISTLLCAPSARAAAQLRAESVPGAIAMTGDVACDVLRRHAGRACVVRESWPLHAGEPYILATLHRAELTARPDVFAAVVAALGSLPLPVVWPVHPRTSGLLAQIVNGRSTGRLHLLPPIGYLDAIVAIRDASLVVTDSGGVQREAYWLGTPCVTVRRETEWVETVEEGANHLIDPVNAPELLPLTDHVLATAARWRGDAYGHGSAAASITNALNALCGGASAS